MNRRGSEAPSTEDPRPREARARCAACLAHSPQLVCPGCVGRVCRIPVGVIASEKERSDAIRGQVRPRTWPPHPP